MYYQIKYGTLTSLYVLQNRYHFLHPYISIRLIAEQTNTYFNHNLSCPMYDNCM